MFNLKSKKRKRFSISDFAWLKGKRSKSNMLQYSNQISHFFSYFRFFFCLSLLHNISNWNREIYGFFHRPFFTIHFHNIYFPFAVFKCVEKNGFFYTFSFFLLLLWRIFLLIFFVLVIGMKGKKYLFYIILIYFEGYYFLHLLPNFIIIS